jgi:hypothetical protein
LPRGFTPSAPSILAAAACAARSTTGARSITVDAEPIECRNAYLDGEIAIRAAADERRAFEGEADLPRNGGGSSKMRSTSRKLARFLARVLPGVRWCPFFPTLSPVRRTNIATRMCSWLELA